MTLHFPSVPLNKRLMVIALLATATLSYAEVDKTALGGGLFGYATGTPDTSMQDSFIVESASNPEKVFSSKKVKQSGQAGELPAGSPMDPDKVKYTFKGQSYSITQYLQKTRTTGLLVLKDGKIVFEKYQYDRKPTHRFLSFSMSKTITAMLVGIALQDGFIKSLDDVAAVYVPELAQSAYGKVTIRQLLTMTSGVRWNDEVSGASNSDMLQLNECHMRHRGCQSSLALLAAYKEFAHEPGARFSYSGGDTMVLGHVLRAATKQSVTSFTQERLWNRLGAESDAAWMVDRQGVENVFGHFAATLHDFARLGLLMANKGVSHDGQQILAPGYWQEMTTPQLPASRPKVATSYFGYGYQLWLDPKPGVFCFRGLKGQAIYVDVPKNLVVVRLGVARTDDLNDASERDYMWHGIRAAY
jgi:CubicO group peptidase (beta-lactamase class C family)